jgi:hypothetical protein
MQYEATAEDYLKALRRDAIGAIKPHKQSNVEMRFCAQTLKDFFQTIAHKNLYEEVGQLIKSAFPEEWGASAAGTLRLAALQRAKGPSINARKSTLQEALDLHKCDLEHQRFWRAKQKETSLIIRRARLKRKDSCKRQKLVAVGS